MKSKLLRLSIYDFDGTLYGGDSLVDFWRYAVSRKPLVLLYLPFQILMTLLHLCRLISTKNFKEAFLSFINLFDKAETDALVTSFWSRQERKINKALHQMLLQDKEAGLFTLCISASPDFVIAPMVLKLGADLLICSNYACTEGRQTNRCESENCKGAEKIKRLEKWMQQNDFAYCIEKFYSDSKADLPLFRISKEKYLVKGRQVLQGMPK